MLSVRQSIGAIRMGGGRAMITARDQRLRSVTRLYSVLEQDVLRLLQDRPLPGVSIGTVSPLTAASTLKRDSFSFGLSKLDPKNLSIASPATEQTIFPIGSLSNMFIALCTAKLKEHGELAYDDVIAKFLPNMRTQTLRSCTIGNLLSHTSLIAEVQGLGEFSSHILGTQNRSSSFLDHYTNTSLRVHTGAISYMKSRHNYGILCAILEKIHGLQAEEIISRDIFQPLQMNSTFVGQEKVSVPEEHRADLFQMTRTGMQKIQHRQHRASALSMAYSSTSDMTRLVEALLQSVHGDGPLPVHAIHDFLRPVYRPNEFSQAQGMYFQVERVSFINDQLRSEVADVGFASCGQGMPWAGYQTCIIVSPTRNTGIFVVANAGSHHYAAASIASSVFGNLLKSRSTTIGPALTWKQSKTLTPIENSINGLAMGHREGLPSPALWPQLCGYYGLSWKGLTSPRLLWLFGGEVQVTVDDEQLVIRSLLGPWRTTITRLRGGENKGGVVLLQAHPTNPLYFVAKTKHTILSTAVTGVTNITFDLQNKTINVGLVTLHKKWTIFSLRVWVMTAAAYVMLQLVGKGRAWDIMEFIFV